MAIKTFTTGEVLTAADTNTYLANSGLVYVTGTTFTTSAAVSLPASTFSSTFTSYRIIFVATVFSAENNLTMRMRAAGADNTVANYEFSIIGYNTAGTLNGVQGQAQTSATISAGVTSGLSLSLDIYNPQAAASTRFTMTSFGKSIGSSVPSPQSGGGAFTGTTSFDALSFLSASNMTGSYTVYGYRIP